ncbi:nucleic-acid-binding protein containing a Zn-ribbon-like protein [Rhizorhabdus wittichii RW1]|uniref:Nucleic-acid-binding protein containing a Zn-ribbon-like protein n=1 Tax=Rhizorhabdus wittichii (strain DSM 6014 / CCUG 31198 / JCM 15750 / NBRC 105917 / EY 4224 / RW1) TaxID=392499 RepID=A0A9J9HBC9_RHIWR|nr:nucleic-acid-binding protein containing a Zn-ribbon-like protein [Rhizorhabdus wittichii RW1]
MTDAAHYLPEGLPAPALAEPELEAPYWEGAREERLLVQRCGACATWQWGPEWICHKCLSSDMRWTEVAPRGRIYSYERVWHPAHPVLKGHTPFLAVLVELPEAGNVRMIGNLLGDPLQDVQIGSEVVADYEHHNDATPPYTLVHWRIAQG